MGSNSKEIVKWVSIAVTIIVVVVSNIVAADVRNKDRDDKQEARCLARHNKHVSEISTIQADTREIKTHLSYLRDAQKKQESVNIQMLKMMREIKG